MTDLAIVTTHYRLPPKRLEDFISWNDAAFRLAGIRLFIVTNRPCLRLPDYARAVVFPLPMDRFALSWTSNYGVRSAMDSGATLICKTDPDMLMSSNLLSRIAAIGEKEAAAPLYRMAQSAQEARERPQACKAWAGSRGTIAMHSGAWEAVSGYDERMIGYGPEDGDICDRCKREGIKVRRLQDTPIFHIAHDEAAPQGQGRRNDQWGRDSGFNTENRPEINAIRKLNDWRDPEWGRFTK